MPSSIPPDRTPDLDPDHGPSRRRFLQAGGLTVGAAWAATVLPVPAAAHPRSALEELLVPFGGAVPFSFTYGGTPSAQLLRRWTATVTERTGRDGTNTTVTWIDPVSGLRVHWVVSSYSGSAVVRWVVNIDNHGSARSAVVGDLLALDTAAAGHGGDWTIHTNNGSTATATDFAPVDIPLAPDTFRLFSTTGGRPTNGAVRAGRPGADVWNAVVGGTAAGYVNDTQHWSGTPGASVSLTFAGTSVEWIGAKNVDVGIGEVLVDGEPAGTVDCYAPTWLRQQTMFRRDGLSDGPHTITVRVTGRANAAASGASINLDAFRVEGAVVDDTDTDVVYADAPADRTDVFGGWPYLNVDWGSGGVIAALGWPGQWAMEAERSGDRLVLRGGMSHDDDISDGDHIETTGLASLWLDPGESIRTPSIVWLPWRGGDWIDAQNVWRRWFVHHHMPTRHGEPVAPLSPSQSDDYFPDQYDTAQDELAWLDAYGAHHATAGTGGTTDHWWIDAGWSALPAGAKDWNHPGTWEPDPERYPEGLAPVNDRAHRLGMRTIVWFEPERVRPDTWLYDNHPEWLLRTSADQNDNFLLDFADAAVQDWAIGHMSGLIRTQHIDVYREDFNVDPLPFWNHTDPAGRRGITQIRYVEGHLRYWTALQDRHPGLVIDTCASGGRRLDVETMATAVNLLRSDFVLDALGNQIHQYGVSSWIPLTGDAVRITGSADDAYNARSAMAPSFHAAVDVRDPEAPWDALRRFGAEWRSIASDLYGDYHPLLPFDAGQAGWTAWQFHRPSARTGHLQAFRRPQSGVESQRLVLHGLSARTRYRLTDLATGAVTTATGASLMSTGVIVTLPTAPAATTMRWHAV